jgi:hypothetical protein
MPTVSHKQGLGLGRASAALLALATMVVFFALSAIAVADPGTPDTSGAADAAYPQPSPPPVAGPPPEGPPTEPPPPNEPNPPHDEVQGETVLHAQTPNDQRQQGEVVGGGPTATPASAPGLPFTGYIAPVVLGVGLLVLLLGLGLRIATRSGLRTRA